MKMLSVKQTADKWNLSPRTIQNFCRHGKIEGAVNFGKSWMIPENALRPKDGRRKEVKQAKAAEPLIRKSPFLNMTDLYNKVGKADECGELLYEHPEAQTIFLAEIAYSRGEIDKVYEVANYFLHSHTGLYAVISSGILLGLCAIWRGDVNLWYQAKKHLMEAPCKTQHDRDIVALALASMDSAVRNSKDFPDWFTRGCFDNLPRDAHPAARVYYIKNLLITAQEIALGNAEMEGVSRMGLMKVIPYIMEPMISQMVVDKIVLAEIHLRLLCAIAYHQSGDDVRGGEHLDKAIYLCLEDDLYGPLVECRRQLGLFLDEHLMAISPAALKKVKELHKKFHAGWTIVHNEVLKRTVEVSLTARERQVARLAAFGLPDHQISRQLSLSESTVKVLIRSAKTKTNVSKRKELSYFI